MNNHIGIVGIGVMGSNIALNFSDNDTNVSVYNKSQDKINRLIAEDSSKNISGFTDLEEFVNFYGLMDFMTLVDGANNIYAKGKGDRVHDHFNKISQHPDHVLLVGDTLHDAEVAALVGCRALLFEKGHFCEERLRNSIKILNNL